MRELAHLGFVSPRLSLKLSCVSSGAGQNVWGCGKFRPKLIVLCAHACNYPVVVKS